MDSESKINENNEAIELYKNASQICMEDKDSVVKLAECLVNELFNFRDKYYEDKEITERISMQKVVDVKQKLQETLIALDNLCWNKGDKAFYYLCVGKALNVIADYDPKCQESLAKSIKLNPKLSEAWYQLGECHWKNNDIDDAFNCFKSALEHQSDKYILRAMSMIIRHLPSNSSEEKRNRMSDSISRAKEALKLDMNDGKSWAVLGSAYLNYFLTNPFNPSSMKKALSAYKKAIKDPIANTDPDLHYNYGIALQYESDFDEYLNQWCISSCLDPTWKFPKESISQTIIFIDSLMSAMANRGKMKEKRFRQLTNGLKEPKLRLKELGPYSEMKMNDKIELRHVSISDLKDGPNSNLIILCKVICGVVQGDQLAYTIIISDECGTLIPVRIFNLGQGKGPVIGDSVAIPEPYVEKMFIKPDTIQRCMMELSRNSAIFKFDHVISESLAENGIDQLAIRVSIPSILVVNGRKINNQWTALPVVQNLYFTDNWLSSLN